MVKLFSRRPSLFVRGAARALRTEEKRIEAWERLILTSFAVTLLVFGARYAHMLDGVETWWLDKMANVDRPRSTRRSPSSPLPTRLSDPSLFGGMSQLHPAGLVRVLTGAIGHRPRGVVLDIQIHPANNETAERADARVRLYRVLKRLRRPTVPLSSWSGISKRKLACGRPATRCGPPGDDLTSDRASSGPTRAPQSRAASCAPCRGSTMNPRRSRRCRLLGAAIDASIWPRNGGAVVGGKEASDPSLPWRIVSSGNS